MRTFASLKSKLKDAEREMLDFIWQYYLRTGSWPTARVVLGKWDKPQLDQILEAIPSGAFLMENESSGSTIYELRFLGILCTSEGDTYFRLLGRYLSLLREIFFNQQEKDSVSQADAEKELSLKPAETIMLGRLAFSGFLPCSGSHSQNFDTWQVSLPRALENLPSRGPLEENLNQILDDASRVAIKVRLRDRIADISLMPDPFDDPALRGDHLGGGRVPVVFISYSHDSRDHKIWVLELARRLRSHGIDARLDQWDLVFGDDVPKFMERNVSEAERVLMICTETYVRKVDEGRGGVGYEAMIVTGELVRDLGTNKFIPVIRQDPGKVVLPKCIGTRFWANLSAGENFEEEFTKLIEQLRRMPPPSKPPLGGGLPLALPTPLPPVSIKAFSDDPSNAYQEALSLAQASDLVTWRKLVTAKKEAVVLKLNIWRESVGKEGGQPLPAKDGEIPAFVGAAMQAYAPLIAVALAGVESNQPKFNQQGALIYDLLEAPGWERSGLSIVVTMPEAAAFTFQALLGAMAVFSNQNSLICDLATLRISDPIISRESGPLYAEHRLIGWPRSFDTKLTPAWNYLYSLPEIFPWIVKVFGSVTVFRECLCGHYLILSWIEFLDFLRARRVIEEDKNLLFDVPPLFFRFTETSGGVRRVLEDRNSLLALSTKHGIDADKQIAVWPEWVRAGFKWIEWASNYTYIDRSGGEALMHFADDLHR